jgi:hypothetical protein
LKVVDRRADREFRSETFRIKFYGAALLGPDWEFRLYNLLQVGNINLEPSCEFRYPNFPRFALCQFEQPNPS